MRKQWLVRHEDDLEGFEHDTYQGAWEAALSLFEDETVKWVEIVDRAGDVVYRVTVRNGS